MLAHAEREEIPLPLVQSFQVCEHPLYQRSGPSAELGRAVWDPGI